MKVVKAPSILEAIRSTKPSGQIFILEGAVQACKFEPSCCLYLIMLYDGETSLTCCYYESDSDWAMQALGKPGTKVRLVGKIHQEYSVVLPKSTAVVPTCMQVFHIKPYRI